MILEAMLANAAILLGVVLILWAIAVQIRDVSFIDSFWGAGMALLALVSWRQLAAPGYLATLLLAMTAIWGLRLAIYLFIRWRREGPDQRYERILRKNREKGGWAMAALFKVFLAQGVLLYIVSSPAQYGILEAGTGQQISGLALIGFALWCVGIFFEWVGDWQLARFKSDPANEGEVMDRGLWRWTRHPNYFGDACVWWGICIAAASAGWWVAAATIVGPIFLTFTLMKWSGAALLEKGMEKSRPGYAEYKRRVSPFFPRPPKKAARAKS